MSDESRDDMTPRKVELDFDGTATEALEEAPVEEAVDNEDANDDEPKAPEEAYWARDDAQTGAFATRVDPYGHAAQPQKRQGRGKTIAAVAVVLLAFLAIAGAVGTIIGQNNAGQKTTQQEATSIETPDTNRTDDDSPSTTDNGTVADTQQDVATDDDVVTLPSNEQKPVAQSDNDNSQDADEPNEKEGQDDGTDGDAKADDKSTKDDEKDKASTKDAKAASESHEHSWAPYNVTTKVTKAKTHKVKVPAQVKNVTEYHTTCNVCMAKIDGQTAEHEAETGHVGYTTNVPSKVNKVVRQAYTKTVVDTPAMTVKTWHQKRCSRCGKVRDLGKTMKVATPVKSKAASK